MSRYLLKEEFSKILSNCQFIDVEVKFSNQIARTPLWWPLRLEMGLLRKNLTETHSGPSSNKKVKNSSFVPSYP